MAKEMLAQDLPAVKKLVKEVLHSEYQEIERMGGLTNHTYKITLGDGSLYVVRIPGEGTEELINRRDEKISTELACQLGIDADLLYFGEDGSKVTQYIPKAVTMSAASMREIEKIRQAADIFRKLHGSRINTGVPFEVFDMAAGYEKIIAGKQVRMFEDYQEVKEKIMKIKAEIDRSCVIEKVPCHNDALCENWVMSDEKLYLIDWEYAGMNDGVWDLADISIEAAYDHQLDEALLTEYFGMKPTVLEWKHFLANKLYVDYLWTLWAKTRVPYDGQPMEDWAAERYARLKQNLLEFSRIEAGESKKNFIQ